MHYLGVFTTIKNFDCKTAVLCKPYQRCNFNSITIVIVLWRRELILQFRNIFSIHLNFFVSVVPSQILLSVCLSVFMCIFHIYVCPFVITVCSLNSYCSSDHFLIKLSYFCIYICIYIYLYIYIFI